MSEYNPIPESDIPGFLDPRRTQRKTFSDGEKNKAGSLTEVISFDATVTLTDSEGEELGIDTKKLVAKRYTFPVLGMKEAVFPKNIQYDVVGQAKFLKQTHQKIQKFFSGFPDLVVPTNFVVGGKKKMEVLEVMPRIDGIRLNQGIADLQFLPKESRECLKDDIGLVCYIWESAIKKSNAWVPDINRKNFIVTPDGHLHLIDTNVYYNWKEISEETKKILLESLQMLKNLQITLIETL